MIPKDFRAEIKVITIGENPSKKPLEKCQRYELFTKRLSLFLETEAKKVLFNIVPNETTSDKLKRQKQKQNKEKEHSRSKQARALKDLDFGLIEKRFFTSSHCAAENGT